MRTRQPTAVLIAGALIITTACHRSQNTAPATTTSTVPATTTATATSSTVPAATTTATPGVVSPAPVVEISTTTGDQIASADIDAAAAAAATITGTGPDGTVYTLQIPKFALRSPATITMRALAPVPLTGGRLVAGVQLGPDGTDFVIPATLTITPPNGVTGLVPLQYNGAPTHAKSTLATLESYTATSIELSVAHFSGAALAIPDTPDALRRWITVPPTSSGASAAEQYAATVARVEQHAYEYATAIKAAVDPTDIAQTRGALVTEIENAHDEWRTTVQPALEKIAATANLDDLATLRDLLGGVIRVEHARTLLNPADDPTADGIVPTILDLKDEYIHNLVTQLDTDAAFQRRLNGGQVSDYDALSSMVDLFTFNLRFDALMSRKGISDEIAAHLAGWLHQYAVGLASRCAAPVEFILYVLRQVALFGDDEARDALTECLPTPPTTPPRPTTTEPRPLPPIETWTGKISGHADTKGNDGSSTTFDFEADVGYASPSGTDGHSGGVQPDGTYHFEYTASGGSCTVDFVGKGGQLDVVADPNSSPTTLHSIGWTDLNGFTAQMYGRMIIGQKPDGDLHVTVSVVFTETSHCPGRNGATQTTETPKPMSIGCQLTLAQTSPGTLDGTCTNDTAFQHQSMTGHLTGRTA